MPYSSTATISGLRTTCWLTCPTTTTSGRTGFEPCCASISALPDRHSCAALNNYLCLGAFFAKRNVKYTPGMGIVEVLLRRLQESTSLHGFCGNEVFDAPALRGKKQKQHDAVCPAAGRFLMISKRKHQRIQSAGTRSFS